MLTPAPEPPANGRRTCSGVRRTPSPSAAEYSPPPLANPKDTREMGITVLPCAVATGEPTTVLTSIMDLMFSSVARMMFSIGCFSICHCLLFFAAAGTQKTRARRLYLSCPRTRKPCIPQ